jgi:hypothetical protein
MTNTNSWEKIEKEFREELPEDSFCSAHSEWLPKRILTFFHSHFNSYVESIVPEEKEVFSEEKLNELTRQDNSGINYSGLARSLQAGFNLCRQQILDNHKNNG